MMFGPSIYGSFSELDSEDNRYFKCSYTVGKDTFTVHIIETDFTYTGIIPAVDKNRVNMSSLIPPAAVMAKSKIIGRTNGNFMDTDKPSEATGEKASFYGVFHQYGVLNKDGHVGITLNDPSILYFLGEGSTGWHRYSPALCIASNGSAKIHWFSTKDTAPRMTIAKAIQQYQVIVSGQHCMVYGGKSVFDNIVNSAEGKRIADWTNLANKEYHHNEDVGGGNSKRRRARTFFGHAPSGHCFMVCVAGSEDWGTAPGAGMDLKEGARLMLDLGCDYALNMDGGSPTQMEYKGVKKYSCQSGYPIGSAVCAFAI